jgi:hypothetical protein
MYMSPFRPSLYPSARRAVICIALLFTAGLLFAQFARKPAISKGPRAIGLLVMPPQGKPHLMPVAIMVDGRFYDASAYKASPVPMALESGTVYEVERSGDSLGLFTVKEVVQQRNSWVAQGTFLAKGEAPPSTSKTAEAKPRFGEEEGPPKLRRTPTEAAKPASTPAPPGGNTGGTTPPATPPAATQPSTPAPEAPEAVPEDPNRPVLRRGTPDKSAAKQPIPPPTKKQAAPAKPTLAAKPESRPAAKTEPRAVTPEIVPAISDADGPEARPFTYDMKPEEEQAFRTKMLSLAADELRKQVKEPAVSSLPAGKRTAKTQTKSQPSFDEVQLRVFDVSLSNEPVLVLTATAHMPSAAKDPAANDYYVTEVARVDVNGDMHKLLSVITDPHHLDVNPRLQLIDAVDADGDGRAELLFRQLSDAGTAYAIYRVHPDRLWAIYEGVAQ